MSYHNFIYMNTGELYGFGENINGQLGLGHNRSVDSLILLMIDFEIKQIICGFNFSMLLKNNGELWVFGCNDYGQLGLGHKFEVLVPTLLMVDPEIKQVVCGHDHSVILKNNNDILVFGSNICGQLGLPYDVSYRIPRVLNNSIITNKNIKIKEIICGMHHTMIHYMDGTIVVFGDNQYGQLGVNKYMDEEIYEEKCEDEQLLMELTFDFKSKVKKIICGRYHTLMLTENNDLFGFGFNCYYQLGLGDEKSRFIPTLLMNKNIKQMSCGGDHNMILTHDNELFVFGFNDYNQCGISNTTKKNSHVELPELLVKDNSINYVLCGFNHSIIIKENCELLVCGINASLGLGFDNDHKSILKPLIKNSNIIGVNGCRFGHIKWQTNLYSKLSKKTQHVIFAFLLVCRYYRIKYNVNMVKYMKHEVIKYLFY